MVSSIPMNMGYNNNPYVVMPLNKTRDDGMTVESSTPATKFPNGDLITLAPCGSDLWAECGAIRVDFSLALHFGWLKSTLLMSANLCKSVQKMSKKVQEKSLLE